MTTMLMIKDEAFHGDIEEQASDATILRARRLSHYLQHSSQRLADTFCWASVHLAQTFMTRVTVTSNELGKTQLATYVPPNAGAKNMPQIRNVNAILHRQDSRKLQETGHTYSGTKGKYVPPHLRMVDANTCLSSQVWQKVQKEGKSFQRTLSDVSMASTDTGTSVISDDATSCFSPSDGCPGMVRFSADIEVHYVEAYSRQAQWGCEEEGTSWWRYATRRQERFRVRAHGHRLCSLAGCSCDDSGLCSVGGQLATEVGISAEDIFSTWRRITCIPATVPNHRLKHGLTWHTRRPQPSSRAIPHLASSQAWPQLNMTQ